MAFDFPLPLGNSAFLLPTQAVILALSLLVTVMLGTEMFKSGFMSLRNPEEIWQTVWDLMALDAE